MSAEICDQFVETGECGHSDAEHDALADGAAPVDATLTDDERELLSTAYTRWEGTSPEYQELCVEDALVKVLRARVANAWDEGYVAGHSNTRRRMLDEPNAPASPNPYRAALGDATTATTETP